MDEDFLKGIGVDEEKINLILEKSRDEAERQNLIFSVKSEMSKRGVKNLDAAMKLFDTDTIEDDGKSISEKIDGFVSENEYLFEQNNPKPVFSANAGTENKNGITKEEFNKMGYIQRLKLFNENPEKYRQLAE